MTRPAYIDAHCHVDFAIDAVDMLRQAQEASLGLFAVTCEPDGYLRVLEAMRETQSDYVVAGAGLHPWWVAGGRVGEEQVCAFERMAPDAVAFGELGLDFSDKHTSPESHGAQIAVFERAVTAAAASSRAAGVRKPVSIHSVRAADEVLDILEQTGCLEACSCIFHWFSGSTQQIWRAIDAGCWFSVNEFGLRTGRGREYAKLIPANRLLVETDLPEEHDPSFGAAAVIDSLERSLAMLKTTRGTDVTEVTCANAQVLLGL